MVRRLARMSPSEVAWRLRAATQEAVDGARVAVGWPPGPRRTAVPPAPAMRLSDVAPGSWADPGARPEEAAWAAGLRAQADPLVGHRLTFFGLERQDLG